jgi:hypothetical protein
MMVAKMVLKSGLEMVTQLDWMKVEERVEGSEQEKEQRLD